MAAKRSSVVLGLVGVVTSSLSSLWKKSQASEEGSAACASCTPAREKKAGRQ